MSCEEALHWISARMDREISPENDEALERHLGECAECRTTLDALRAQDSDLRRAFAPHRRRSHHVAGVALGNLRGRSTGGWSRFVWMASGLAAGFVLALMILRPWGSSPAPAPVTSMPQVARMAKLSVSKGLVEVFANGAWAPLTGDAAIEPGSRVRTGPEGLCELRTLEGSELRLASATEVLLRSSRKVDLERGRLWSTVQPAEEPFQVSIPEATVTALGTKFVLERSETSRVLTMVEGLTRVSGKAGDELVPQGWIAEISEKGIEKRRERDILRATRWVNQILVLKGPEHPELARRLQSLLAEIGEAKMRNLADDEILELGDSCVQPLLSFIISPRVPGGPEAERKREHAAGIVGKLATRRFVYELIELLPDDSREIRFVAASALKRLTGETQGLEPDGWKDRPWSENEVVFKRWLEWWQTHQGEYADRPNLK